MTYEEDIYFKSIFLYEIGKVEVSVCIMILSARWRRIIHE